MSAFSWKQAQQAPWALDDLRLLWLAALTALAAGRAWAILVRHRIGVTAILAVMMVMPAGLAGGGARRRF